MAWIDPRTWVAEETVTASLMNQISDDLKYLHDNEVTVQMVIVDFTVPVGVADNLFYFVPTTRLTGYELTFANAKVITAGTTNVTTIQIYNMGSSAFALSTALTIDSGETSSATAATPYVIDTAKNAVTVNSPYRVDVTTVSSTPPRGLIVTLGFKPA